jgi:hypothetical protein
MSEPEVRALGRQLRRIGALMRGPDGDTPATTSLLCQWLYQLAVGWDCEQDCEQPDNPTHSCTGALNDLANHHGWPDWFVTQLRDARRGVRILIAETDALDARHGREQWP